MCYCFYMMIPLEKHEEELRKRDAVIEDMQRQLKNLQMVIFGSQSERQPIVESNPDQPFLDFGGSQVFPVDANDEDTESANSSEKGRSSKKSSGDKKKGGNQLVFPDHLDVEDLFLDVPEDEKSDPLTGEKFSQIGEDVTKKLVRVKAAYKIIRLRRPVYGARQHGVVQMDIPQSIAGFSKLDESFFAESSVRRTCDHIPF